MGNNSIVKIVVIILIPVIVFFCKGYLQDFLKENQSMFVDLTPVETIQKVVSEHSTSMNILKNYNAKYINYEVFTGIDAVKLQNYFPNQIVVSKGKKKVKRVVVPKPKYKIDFVFLGGDNSYITIGKKLLSIGDRTSRGEVIKDIESDRIQLQGKWGLRWIPVNY